MTAPSGRKKLRADLLVIIGLLLSALLAWLALNLGREAGGCVVVRVDGAEVERHSLDLDGVFPLNGGTNILVIENGEAYLSEANCPDQICVKQGHIHFMHEVITCLPNRLTVTVEGGESNGVDFVVGG